MRILSSSKREPIQNRLTLNYCILFIQDKNKYKFNRQFSQYKSVNLMNKVYQSHLEQLKCNFCTQWFTVNQTFAVLQRYSLNICQKCYNNFQYKIVHPNTYEIHQIKLIPTAVYLGGIGGTNNYELASKKQLQLLRINGQQRGYLPKDQYNSFKQLIDQQIYLLQSTNEIMEPIKQKINSTYKKLFDLILSTWKSATSDINQVTKFYLQAKWNYINKLSDRAYNFKTDNQKLLCAKQYEKNIYEILERKVCKMKNQVKQQEMLRKLREVLEGFLGNNFEKTKGCKGYSSVKNKKQNKENIGENNKHINSNKRKLTGLRQKLTDSNHTMMTSSIITNYENNQKKNNTLNTLAYTSSKKSIGISTSRIIKKQPLATTPTNSQSYKSLRSLFPNSKYKQIQKSQQNLALSRSKYSYKNLKASRCKSRASQAQYLQSDLVSNKCYYELDAYRDQISKIMKQKNESHFESYMPVQVFKDDINNKKNLGEKEKLQYLVELKVKTIVNEKVCQLINQNLSLTNFTFYLKSIQFSNSIEMLRFVKVNLTDADFDCLLNFLSQKTNNNINTLVITNNLLTNNCISALSKFCQINTQTKLRNIYMGNNYIKLIKCKSIIEKLKENKIFVHV